MVVGKEKFAIFQTITVLCFVTKQNRKLYNFYRCKKYERNCFCFKGKNKNVAIATTYQLLLKNNLKFLLYF